MIPVFIVALGFFVLLLLCAFSALFPTRQVGLFDLKDKVACIMSCEVLRLQAPSGSTIFRTVRECYLKKSQPERLRRATVPKCCRVLANSVVKTDRRNPSMACPPWPRQAPSWSISRPITCPPHQTPHLPPRTLCVNLPAPSPPPPHFVR